ncbi:MAG TPA: type II secretion system F family protein [Gaiellaceae bacterium]
MKRVALIAAVTALAAALPVAATAGGVRIAGVDPSGFPRIDVTAVAPQGAPAPKLSEDGHPVAGYAAVNLAREKAIVLALDRSESMSGRPLRLAVTAAQQFIAATGPHDHVGVVAFGSDAIPLTRFSSSPSDARAALEGLSVDSHSGTALYDAIVLAAQRLVGDERPGRAIVVVTDGKDVSSSASIDAAVRAAHAAHAAVYTIGIAGPSFTATALRRLASETGGSYHEAAGARDLRRVYASLADELARTWQLSYVTSARPGMHLTLRATDRGAAVTTNVEIPGASDGVAHASGVIPSFGYSGAGTFAFGLLVGVIVLLAVCFWFAAQRGDRVRARIEPHLGTVERNPRRRHRTSSAAARAQVADVVEHAFGGLRQFQRLQVAIDRADLPLRAGELLALAAGGAVFAGLVTAVSATSALVTLIAMAGVGVAPIAWVRFRAAARIRKFDSQLPDILITIAASLKAGHSFRQGMQSVVEEGSDPAAKEFRRVITETQLGKPMDDALLGMSERIGSKDLTFVINAVTIQRQIGGSLASLFDMVADTVRQRQQFARKVRGLTAMGRMSAYVLVGLPFFVAAIVTMMNPSYMAPLYHTATGQKLVFSGLAMIAVGSVILKKIAAFRG